MPPPLANQVLCHGCRPQALEANTAHSWQQRLAAAATIFDCISETLPMRCSVFLARGCDFGETALLYFCVCQQSTTCLQQGSASCSLTHWAAEPLGFLRTLVVVL
jgi:hypothetical protein